MINRKTRTNHFQVVTDTTDCTVRISGATLEELFSHALAGLAHLVYKNHTMNGALQTHAPIKVSSIDVNSLLVDFLSEALYQSETQCAVFHTLSLKHFSNSALTGEISGSRIPQRDRNIRAVTHKGVRIVRNERGLWHTEVIFDV